MSPRTRPVSTLAFAALAAACAAGCPHRSALEPGTDAAALRRPLGPQRVTFSSNDGWTLVGDLWSPLEPTGGHTAGVVLVHQLGSSRAEWSQFIATARGLHPRWTILAFDLRGHGESTLGPDGPTRWPAFGNDPARWSGLTDDVSRAADYVRGLTFPPSVFIMGSSIGSSAAIRYASDPRSFVGGVVLLSPGLAYHGLDTLAPMAAYARSDRPALLVASEGDTDSATAIAAFMDGPAQGHPHIESLVYPGTGAHGVSLGAPGLHPDVWRRIGDAIDRWTAAPPPGPGSATEGDAGAGVAEDRGDATNR